MDNETGLSLIVITNMQIKNEFPLEFIQLGKYLMGKKNYEWFGVGYSGIPSWVGKEGDRI